MKCMHCQGQLIRGTAPFHVDRHGYHLVLDTVPAWVCGQCGEALFEEQAVASIQAAITALDRETQELMTRS